MSSSFRWFVDIWRGKDPNITLKQYVIALDEAVDASSESGRGSYGAVFDVKYNGATCVGKRVLDILVGLGGHEMVGRDQYGPLVERFQMECDLLRRLRHPNVVQFMGIYQPTQDVRGLTLVMEKLHMDAQHFIDNHKNVPLSVKLQILKDTSSGLLHIHSHNIIHRDLNAGNVLLTEDLRAKVADFGMSRIVDRSQVVEKRGQMTSMPGAPDYMPPEAVTGDYDERLDSFSLGKINFLIILLFTHDVGHFMLYLINEVYPQPERLVLKNIQGNEVQGLEIERRKRWIKKMGEGHILYNTVLSCLRDESSDRVSMTEISKKLKLACEELPRTYKDIAQVLLKVSQ